MSKSHSNKNIDQRNNNCYDIKDIVNAPADMMSSDDLKDILSIARKKIFIDNIANIGMIFSAFLCIIGWYFVILLCLFLLLKIYIRTIGLINLNYTIDEEQMDIALKRVSPMLKISSCQKIWRITQTSKVIDTKYSGGASSQVLRKPCKAINKAMFPFKSNTIAASFKSNNETIIFLPDKLFIIQGTKIGALSYYDISTYFHTTTFIESSVVPKDTIIVRYTWEYVNKSGGPDKRFKNNRKLPICKYGEMELKSYQGLNTILMFSNPNSI